MPEQLLIKIILIAVFVVFAFVLLRPGGSARNQAMRTIAMLVFLAVVVVTVALPGLINDLANAVGVGRGADLLLYAFIVVFLGTSIASARRRTAQDAQITTLARHLALAAPLPPLPAGTGDASAADGPVER